MNKTLNATIFMKKSNLKNVRIKGLIKHIMCIEEILCSFILDLETQNFVNKCFFRKTTKNLQDEIF